jgi:hypothetical protein
MHDSEGTVFMRSAFGRPSGARAARRVMAAVASAAMAAGVTAGTASTATASITKPAASLVAPLPGVPPFFAGIISDNHPDGTFEDVVKIFPSVKGIAVATVRVPGARELFSLARLGDDQHFVVGSFDRDACVSHLWTFAIDAAGQPGPVAPLAALPQFSGAISELAGSADGTALAFDGQICTGGQQAGLVHLTPGQPTSPITHWDIPGDAAIFGLSLSGDGSALGFTFLTEDPDGNDTFQVFTKPADAPAGHLLKGAHQVPGLGASAVLAALSPSGDQLYAETQTPPGQGPVTLSLISASTGALIRQITQLNDGFANQALDHAGQHMLAYGQNPGPGHADVELIDLSSGQNLTFTITNPVVESPISTFAW